MSIRNDDVFDNFEEFESHDTAKKLPVGWLLLFFGLILWGIYYIISFTPGISDWSQEKEFKQSMEVVQKK